MDIHTICRQYYSIIQQIERTADPIALERLEERRVEWHNKVLDAFEQHGIHYEDRWDVTRIACQIALNTYDL
ncbi:MAG: hypothetical protein GY801_45230 [bacterium]|nr:hypothetical protein [bacterium]